MIGLTSGGQARITCYITAEKWGALRQALEETAKELADELADEMYEEGEQRASRKSPRGFLSSEDIAALTEANKTL